MTESISDLNNVVPDGVMKDPNGRQFERRGKVFDVYLYTLNFKEPWTKESAESTVREFIDAIKSVPSTGILCPIINTNGLDLMKFNVGFTGLIPLQSKLGVQMLVGATGMVKQLVGLFRGFGSNIHNVDTLDDAQQLLDAELENSKV